MSEEPPAGSTRKPEELYGIIERFSQVRVFRVPLNPSCHVLGNSCMCLPCCADVGFITKRNARLRQGPEDGSVGPGKSRLSVCGACMSLAYPHRVWSLACADPYGSNWLQNSQGTLCTDRGGGRVDAHSVLLFWVVHLAGAAPGAVWFGEDHSISRMFSQHIYPLHTTTLLLHLLLIYHLPESPRRAGGAWSCLVRTTISGQAGSPSAATSPDPTSRRRHAHRSWG